MDEVSEALETALRHPSDKPPVFRKLWQERSAAQNAAVNHLPTRVTFDNNTSDNSTIVAVFAYDRMGLRNNHLSNTRENKAGEVTKGFFAADRQLGAGLVHQSGGDE